MHVALISGTRPGARAAPATAASPVRAITVRAIPAAAYAQAAPPATVKESAALPVESEAKPLAQPSMTVAKAAEPRPSALTAASAVEPAPVAVARTPLSATVAAPRAEAADRVVALPAAPDYLLGATLDPGPQPIGDIEPEYPASANLQEGKVVIRVLISEAGRVDNVAVVRAAPPGLFEAATLEAFGKAQFTPARAAGVPVKSQITVEVHFLPINRGSRISGRSY